MIDERDFEASRFWKNVDDAFGAGYKRRPQNPILTGLTAYFLVLVANNWGISRDRNQARARKLLSQANRQKGSCNDQVEIIFDEFEINIKDEIREHEIDISFEFLLAVNQILKGIPFDEDLVLYIFDARFRELAQHKEGIDSRLTHFAAVLSNTLADPRSVLIDAFCTTGEFFKTMGGEQWKRISSNLLAPAYHPRLNLPLRMRLILLGLRDQEVLANPDDGFRSYKKSESVALCDFGFGGAQLQHIQNGMEHFSLDDISTDPYAISSTIEKYGHSLVIAIVPSSTRSAKRPYLQEFRRNLIETRRLKAVIDFPTFSTKLTPRSAWILDASSSSSDNTVLMINLRKLGVPRTSHDIGLYAEFAGRVYRKALGKKIPSRWATPDRSSETDRIRDIFSREFDFSYEDVAGLCTFVGRDRLMRNPKLVASEFLSHSSPKRSLLSIDYNPILPLLKGTPSSRSNAIYVIGNNGEGKSLMLQQLASDFSEQGRRVVGICFGASDRFPRSREEKKDFRGFIYEGARGAANAVNAQKIGKHLAKHLISVYRDILRGRIFQGLLRRLGFETKVFIIGDEDMAPLTGDFSGSIVQLTSDVEETESLLRSIGTEWMQPAFIRGRRGSIARFSELSSGEQQVLSMVIRLVATVEPGTLFLIDEPEISLHVSWQKSLPSLLGMILREFECDVVVATHSPLVISSATGTRDHCFVTRRQRLEPIHREDQHSVESILLAGFETYTPNNRLVHERCAAIVAAAIEAANSGTGERDVIAKLRDDLSQMRRILKDQREESDGSKDSERLIAKAREAVEQISRWRDVPMTPAEEN